MEGNVPENANERKLQSKTLTQMVFLYTINIFMVYILLGY